MIFLLIKSFVKEPSGGADSVERLPILNGELGGVPLISPFIRAFGREADGKCRWGEGFGARAAMFDPNFGSGIAKMRLGGLQLLRSILSLARAPSITAVAG